MPIILKIINFLRFYIVYILLSALFLLIGIFLIYIFVFKNNSTNDKSLKVTVPKTEATAKPISPLPSGSQTYRLSHGKNVKGPKIYSLTIDPLTPDKGSSQKVSLSASYELDITNVEVTLLTDSMSQNLKLSLVSGSRQNGVWEGSWNVNDSYNYKYGIRFLLESNKDNYNDIMWFRQ